MKSPSNSLPGLTQLSRDRAEAIFDGALQLPAGQRGGYVNQACADDNVLREHVELLLKAHDSAGDFLENGAGPSSDKTIVPPPPLTEKAGDRIGRYKLLQQIGEGGCGVVYMAEQEEPVHRRVALKVIKLGMDTKSVIARFEAERQALALMDHPNIARVLDAGTTHDSAESQVSNFKSQVPHGRPYFVMELVRGIKITDYCDQNKLSTGARLELVIKVCHAIQHAHQKGIIHRDIKPSNILVTLHDGVPVPKVIDFGIAKATQGKLTDQTLFTAFEQFIGTPAYMSPEQAEMSGMDIDTRCDIYALGVLLYQLLTGQTPFDAKELLASGLDKMRQTIREKEPESPSTRLRTMLSADQTMTATHRQTDPPKLIHILRGDLDWIVMKALEKDRTRRYETASALAMDIQRHLDNEPVLASPPSRLYRFRKLVRRNQAVFAAAGAVCLALVTGLGLSLYLFIREREARERAVAAEKEQSRLLKEAERGGLIGQKLTQAGLLLSREQYAEAEKIIADLPPHQASVAVLDVLGMVHARRGEWRAAITNFTRSIELNPLDLDAYHSLAPLIAESGDQDAYRSLCARIIRQFENTSDPIIAERMAKDCMILAPPASSFEPLRKMVAAAIKAGPNHQFWDYFQFVKGLAEFRFGNFRDAVEWLEKIVTRERDPNRTVAAHMVLAMAQYRLDQSDEARLTLSKGIEFAKAHVSRVDGPIWNDQLAAHVLMREARELIERGK